MTDGLVLVPGSAPRTGQVQTMKMGTQEHHFASMLTDLNQPPRAWKSAKIEAVMRELVGSVSQQVARRVHSLSGSYQKYLRDLVDCWIATGISPAKVNWPASRQPNQVIHDLVTRVFETHRSVPVAVQDGYVVLPVPRGELMLDGDAGVEAAELRFIEMLVSPWRLRIAQCVHCDKYFGLKQWEHPYKDGTACPRCVPRRKSGASARSARGRRDPLRQKLYDAAAKQFGRRIATDAQWKKKQALKDAIAAALTKRIARDPELKALYPDGVTAKWVTLAKNWQAIEAAVRGLAQG